MWTHLNTQILKSGEVRTRERKRERDKDRMWNLRYKISEQRNQTKKQTINCREQTEGYQREAG